MRALPLLTLLACNPVTASVLTDGIPQPDTDTDTDTDSDTDVDTDTDADTDVDTDPDPDPDPDPTIQLWEGVRSFDFGRCQGEVFEKGVLDLSGEAAAACPQCDYVFQIEVSPTRVCDVPVRSPALRGVVLEGRGRQIYFIDAVNGQLQATPMGPVDAERQGFDWVFSYDYAGNLGNGREFEVEGKVALIAQ